MANTLRVFNKADDGSFTEVDISEGSNGKLLGTNGSGTWSWVTPTKTVQVQILADTVDVDTTSGIGYFYIPASMNGWVLTRATAMVATAGTTNATTIQVRNLTKYASNDALSTAISIASAGTIATAGTVNASYDDVSTNDRIKIYVTGNSTTKAKGLYVVLEFGIT